MSSFELVLENMDLNKSAGFSFPGKKKRDVWLDAFYMSRFMVHKMKSGLRVYKPPFTFAMRGHLREVTDPKTRCVWIAPFETVIIEALMFREVIKQL